MEEKIYDYLKKNHKGKKYKISYCELQELFKIEDEEQLLRMLNSIICKREYPILIDENNQEVYLCDSIPEVDRSTKRINQMSELTNEENDTVEWKRDLFYLLHEVCL